MNTIQEIIIESPIYQETNRFLDKSMQLMKLGSYFEGFSLLLQSMHKMYTSQNSEVYTQEYKKHCVSHPIMKVLCQEPTIKQCIMKPRGYAGDADLIDFFYRLKGCDTNTSYHGRELFSVSNSASSCSSVRWRARHLADLFLNMSIEKERKISCLSIASGHIRELRYVEEAENVFNRFIALDQDNISNDEARKTLPFDFLSIIDESITFIIRDGFKDQKFDFVYSAGLFDYLNDKLAIKLIQKLYDNVAEGGNLLVPNFAKGIVEQAYMDIFMDWKLIYRNENDMIRLSQLAGIPKEKVNLYRDPMCNVIYMRMDR